jgi:DNA-binding transcriptional regulator YiaG
VLQFSGQLLKARREALGLSRMDLAAKAGVSYFTLREWEQVGRAPHASNFVQLVDALDCAPHDLMVDTSNV